MARTGGHLAIGWLLLISPAGAQDAASVARKAMTAGDEKARLAAIDQLADMGPAAKGAVKDLVSLLGDKSTLVRAHAAYALGMIGPGAIDAGPALAKAVSDPDIHVKREAIQALETIRVSIEVAGPALGKALEDPEPSIEVAALDALTDLGPSSVPVLAKALDNPKSRYWAALALGQFGAEAKEAAESLAKASTDERPEVRREVLIALAHMGASAAPAVPAATALLQDADPSVRHSAAYVLGSVGPAAAPSVEALRKAAQSDDPLMPMVCAYAIAKIEPNNQAAREEATKRLGEALHHKDPVVESAAMRAMLELKTPPDEIAPQLCECIVKCDPSLLPEMLAVLGAAGDSGVPALAAALERPEARGQAAHLLGRLGPQAEPAVPALLTALKDQDATVRREVLYALGNIVADKGPVDPAIVAALGDGDVAVQATAAYALGRAGTSAQAALPQLRASLEAEDPLLRVVSAWALLHVAPKDKSLPAQVLPVLMQGVKSENAMVRRGAAQALGMCGSAASPAEPALRALTRDPDDAVRTAALEALEKLGVVVDKLPRTPAPIKRQ
ncbi:MAG: HEAT repeat domain-containing protein [Pirellulales bacterium]